MLKLLVAGILLGALEIYVWVLSAKYIGGFTIFVLTLLAMYFGASLIKKSMAGLTSGGMLAGLGIVNENQASQGLKSVMTILAGIFLIIPGFVSDAIGLILLLPPVQKFMMTSVAPKLQPFLMKRMGGMQGMGGFAGMQGGAFGGMNGGDPMEMFKQMQEMMMQQQMQDVSQHEPKPVDSNRRIEQADSLTKPSLSKKHNASVDVIEEAEIKEIK